MNHNIEISENFVSRSAIGLILTFHPISVDVTFSSHNHMITGSNFDKQSTSNFDRLLFLPSSKWMQMAMAVPLK